jgi:signal transduction histidine kinase
LRRLTGEADSRVREGINYAYDGAQQLHRLVVDLLDLSRIEAQQLQLELQNTDLRSLIREVAGSVRPTAERHEIDLQLSALEERSIVRTDATRVRQILLNLLSNAIKFTKPGGRIDLSLAPCERGWQVTVRDTGPGVDPALADRVFEAFRNDHPRSPQSGAGLGLAISRELARLLGGELSHLKVEGPGACFALCLPGDAAVPPAAGAS